MSVVDAGIAQLVERNLAKVEVEGSRPFSRSKESLKEAATELPFLFEKGTTGVVALVDEASYAGIAQLVERNLAKVEVEGSRPFSRSRVSGEFKVSLVIRVVLFKV